MADFLDTEYDDSLEVENDQKSSARVLSAIKKAERALLEYQGLCDSIDDVYSRREQTQTAWVDADYDLFWASMEIMKPAVYAHAPQPVISPQFKDRRQLPNVTAELLERSVISAFDRTDINEAMACTRDDLIFYNRGQMWVTYESDEEGGGQRICVEHIDRKDFLYPPARKWSEVPWVARRAWMTKQEMRKRFRKASGDLYQMATMGPKPSADDEGNDHRRKSGVWEVWHKGDNKVYWVAEGCSTMLDEDKPHLDLRGFFPCPRPAYGTLRPRTLVPVPDYVRYAGHFKKINGLTRRIYDLLDMLRMKGLIPAGGEIGDVVEQALRDDNNSSLLIPVPGAALMAGSAAGFVQWMPLTDIATAIAGLIEARGQLIEDFFQLSGISDIMRGATEAQETLGAQQLKSQYGSIRVREKIDEMQRIARDVTVIASEIMAENFTRDTLLEMSQMEIDTKREIANRISDMEEQAEEELKGLMQQAQQSMPQGQEVAPEQAQQAQAQLQEAQQQIIAKYAPLLQAAQDHVPLEDVMKLLRDDRARGFAFEIATDSTILTDEIAEKQSRNEFLQTFMAASQGLMQMAAAGEAGGKLAGEVLKFVLQPYRVGRELNRVIDEFIDNPPQLPQEGGEDGDLAAAQMKLAEAEVVKAQNMGENYQAQAQLKMQELELKGAEAQAKSQQDQQKFQLSVQEFEGKIAETLARIEKIQAEIQAMGVRSQVDITKVENDTRKTDIDAARTVADVEARQTDQAMRAQSEQRSAQMGEHQQTFSERQAMQEPAE